MDNFEKAFYNKYKVWANSCGGAHMQRGKVVNLGEQWFYRIREEDKYYIDKTDFIRAWCESGSTVTLLTRLRSFGKTLNMSMVERFFPIVGRYACKCPCAD